MGFEHDLNELADRVRTLSPTITNEEATKHALVLPFLRTLGYDVFNPEEIAPEFRAEGGTKPKDKVDYAVILDGKPRVLVECKAVGENLASDHGQLYRYFGATPAHFGILTDGVEYWFFSDTVQPNVMDTEPFYEMDLREIIDSDVRCLTSFRREHFDERAALAEAEQMRWTQSVQRLIAAQFERPDDELVRWFARKVHGGRYTTAVADNFRSIVRLGFNQEVSDRVKRVVERSLRDSSGSVQQAEGDTDIAAALSDADALRIIQSSVADVVSPNRISLREAKKYGKVLLDDSPTLVVAKLYLGNPNDLAFTIGNGWRSAAYGIESVEQIADWGDELRAHIRHLLAGGSANTGPKVKEREARDAAGQCLNCGAESRGVSASGKPSTWCQPCIDRQGEYARKAGARAQGESRG